MTRYEQGFLTKCAQAGLSVEDSKALMDFVNKQKADEEKRSKQHKALATQNRTARRLESGLGGGVLGALALGGLGVAVGGKYKGLTGLAGGIGGAIGGYHLGKKLGDRTADMMEQKEKLLGVSLVDQLAERRQREERAMHTWQLINQLEMQQKLNRLGRAVAR